jgi:diacylglycerol kinase (ATP)
MTLASSDIVDARPARWYFILNPRAGGRAKDRIRSFIKNHWPEDHAGFGETDAVTGAGPAIDEGRRQGFTGFVAVGGDGTVQSLAACLDGRKEVMGILPAGSGNGLAGWLGLKKDIRQNLRVLTEGQCLPMDTGSVNGHPFVNLSGVGFDAMVAHATRKSRIRGFWPYLLAAIRLTFGDIFWPGRLEWPGAQRDGPFLSVIVANGAVFGYGFRLVPFARVNDGLFTLLIIHQTARWRYLLALPFLLLGRKRTYPWMEVLECSELHVRPLSPTPLQADGEALPSADSYHFRIDPQSLRVMVPADCQALSSIEAIHGAP